MRYVRNLALSNPFVSRYACVESCCCPICVLNRCTNESFRWEPTALHFIHLHAQPSCHYHRWWRRYSYFTKCFSVDRTRDEFLRSQITADAENTWKCSLLSWLWFGKRTSEGARAEATVGSQVVRGTGNVSNNSSHGYFSSNLKYTMDIFWRILIPWFYRHRTSPFFRASPASSWKSGKFDRS
jgi:hypothetical protein